MKFAIIAILLCAMPAMAHAAGDPEKGAIVFQKCAACHTIDRPENNIGPHLMGLFGRKAGSVETYATYSDAMKSAGSKGLVWDEAKVAEYLAAPKKIIPGNKMSFTGLKSPDDIANLEAFLAINGAAPK